MCQIVSETWCSEMGEHAVVEMAEHVEGKVTFNIE